MSQDPNPSQLAVAQAVPGFGGYFLDAAGVPSVYLTDASQRPAAEQALAGFLGRIARVDEITTTLDDTTHTIAGAFSIRAERADPIQGEIANKVGRTTGWTRGATTGTCVDVSPMSGIERELGDLRTF